MCYYSWENPYAEKTNDLVKNRYLKYWKPKTLSELKRCLKKAVEDHNANQQKSRLGNLSPIDFEKKISKLDIGQKDYILKLKPSLPKTKMK